MPRAIGGYGLLELLITATIAACCIQAGLGLFDLVERNRRWQVAAELQRLVLYARGEAVSRQQAVTLCALDGEGACQRDWDGRDIAVFADINGNRRLDDGEALRLSHWPQNRGRLRWRAALGRRYLEYSELGSTHQNGSFVYCQGREQATLVILVNRGGRPYVGDPKGRHCS